jgi:23S rRNA (uracil1939-C5)-methyltransferase
MQSKYGMELEVSIIELNEKGYGVGNVDGKTVWCLNSLPGERVKAEVFKRKKGILYAVSTEIIQSSPYRLEARDEGYLATSPWQILDIQAENAVKKELIQKFYGAHNILLPEFEVVSGEELWNYRNKMEFSFYSDDDGLNLAFHKREGGKSKYIVSGSSLSKTSINHSAQKILDFLRNKGVEARTLKTVLLRSNQKNEAFAVIYLKTEEIEFSQQEIDSLLDTQLIGLHLIYSDPKSLANVVTKILVQSGEFNVTDKVSGLQLTYPVDGFFQVNPPVFEHAMADLRQAIVNIENHQQYELLDMYAGVGTIGLGAAGLVKKVIAVEIFPGSRAFALKNAAENLVENYEFIEAPSEHSLEYITQDRVLVLDPNRPGLHPKLVAKIAEIQPKYIIYLSCNPKTQAENFAALQEFYKIKFFKAYNFYPHTPHVESLLVLEKK